MSIRILLMTTASTALAACATPGPPSVTPLSYEEAFAFESALLARESSAPKPPEKLFIQPANKVEACKLPTTQDQLDRSNFRVYWDGQCKDGYAFGLGRDIAISDTHHYDEITVHNGTGDNWSAARIFYDYVNSGVGYVLGGAQFPANTALAERMDNSIKGFSAQQTLSVRDDVGNVFSIQASSFSPERVYSLSQNFGTIVYSFEDLSAVPTSDPYAPIFTAGVVDPKLNAPLIIAGKLADGSVRHVKNVGGEYEETLLPDSYVNHLMSKYREILTVTSAAGAQLQEVQQIEREYLFKACNGKSSVEGLDDATYTKICTWREQFREPYAIASANYQQQLETLRQQAATADQQRQIQQQIYLQQQILQQQQNQQAWNQLKQTTEELQQQTQRTLDGVTGWRAPQVQQPTISNSERVVCNTVGSITICR